MPNRRVFFFNSISIYLWIALLSLGFPFSFSPNLALQIQNLNLLVVQKIYPLFSANASSLTWESDGLAMQLHLVLCLIFSLIISFFIKKKLFVLRAGLVYLLAYFLLKYGFNKVFLYQFYEPSSTINSSKFGDLDLTVLYWSTMGKAPTYQIFLGVIEVFAAFLLFFNKTRFLALLLSLGIFFNVFFVNLGFGINVKIFTFLLILLTVACLSSYKQQLKFLIGIDSKSENRIDIDFEYKSIIKPFVISIILTETIWIYL